MTAAIPSRVEELTSEWFGQVLDADVTRADVIDAHSGTTGRARVRLQGAADLPTTVFVKLQPFEPEQQVFLRMVGMGTAEARIYATVGDELPVRVPRVWHAVADDRDGSFIMVLEDLVASGCRFPAVGDDDVLDVAESLVDELAALHAAYWGCDLSWLPAHALNPSGGERQRSETAAAGASMVQSALDQFTDDMPPVFRRIGDLYVEHYRDIATLWLEGEQTLVHGDPHIGNLFVDDGRTGFLDWAVTGRYAGIRDVAYFLCNSLPTAVRREQQDALLSRYRSKLSGLGVQLDERRAFEQYRLFSLYSWVSATTTAAMGDRWQPIEIGRSAMVRTSEAIGDLEVIDLLDEQLA
jgi:aminoglycoside phosphotransferase (APT) family kinase protein